MNLTVNAPCGYSADHIHARFVTAVEQVPARAAAAAAVARALAGLPPHQRYSFSSSSEELSSIYGSRCQGQVVEELEDEFYEEVLLAISFQFQFHTIFFFFLATSYGCVCFTELLYIPMNIITGNVILEK